MLMTARTQAQNAADAGALAGAVALVFDSYTDRSASGPAVQSAVGAAAANNVMHDVVSAGTGDVSFPQPSQVRVDVYRSGGRGNPVSTLIASYFGMSTVDITAMATAEAAPANAATCIKPWAVPDKWDERQDPPWDPDDTFDALDKKGNPLPNPDVYVPAHAPGYTGFQQSPQGPDYGKQLLLKAGSPQQTISSSHFFPIALLPNSGASWYRANIPGCWPGVAQIGDLVPVEPGNMTGPTVQGTQDLIDLDPSAYWDGSRVVSSYSPSPRIVVLPVFDPMVYEDSRQHGRQDIEIANLVGFFIENLQGTSVVGRIVPMTGLIRGGGGAGGGVPSGSFLRAIRLVE